ncbi:FH1/FH2 domain-containing protein 1 isoform X2 [Rhinatrema bivittatum]|uniref:FH1/FH2 domain-containing protein 1 isoform X2 n=1 Tax=Rhinatrema bivittatum TaxID=194408 RepID=UPI0011273F17|nr:FH1/FH2 domain-containing protein 1 isoform X2 [Rhinatrema bivittatum]
MALLQCRVQYLDDTDPFVCTNFPEPRRPLVCSLQEHSPLTEQLPGLQQLLQAPLKLEDCALQLSASGNYLDTELSLAEQRDELEGFFDDISIGRKPSLILRTQLSVRVHSIIEKLYNSNGPELRRSLFSLKQLFQEDKDLVPEFVNSEGLTCLIKVGAEADQNYQNYILRALSQIMLFVDGMIGVIHHNETVQWLYILSASPYRLVVKTALKLLIVFIEYTESNAQHLIKAINNVDYEKGSRPWSILIEILEEKNGADSELLIFAMTLINKTLAALPDQDSFYDVTDWLEQQGMENIIQRHMNNKAIDPDLKQKFTDYESALKHEDEEQDEMVAGAQKDRRKLSPAMQESRRTRRSFGNTAEILSSAGSPLSGLDNSAPNLQTVSDSQLQRRPEAPPSGPAHPASQAFSSVEALSGGSRLLASDAEREEPAGETSVESMYPYSSESQKLLSTSTEQISKINGFGETSIFKQRFLENLAATELEKKSALSRGRQDTLTEAVPSGSRSNMAALLSDRDDEGIPLESSNVASSGQSSLRQFNADRCSTISTDKKFMLDMLFSKNKTGSLQGTQEDDLPNRVHCKPLLQSRESAPSSSFQTEEGSQERERFSEPETKVLRAQHSIDAEISSRNLEKTRMTPLKREAEFVWDQREANQQHLKINDLDFTDLCEEDDFDVLDVLPLETGSLNFAHFPPPPPNFAVSLSPSDMLSPSIPPPPAPPPPPPACPPLPPLPPPVPTNTDISLSFPPPPGFLPSSSQVQHSHLDKKKKTVKLFWKELRQPVTSKSGRFGQNTVWTSLEKITVDADKMGHLFESKAKELPSSKKVAEGKKQIITVLDSKRSNAINIGLTVLPTASSIKTAVLNFDEYTINKEGIEKLLTMVPTEEEKQKIQEAQIANPDVPLGSAEQFLLTLSSISGLKDRLQLWAFKLDYDGMEKEIAEPLFDLKFGMEQLSKNQTFKCILAALLAVGNFLNGSNAEGFELTYLQKVSEVKDTVHRQSLLYHLCNIVVDKFPDTSDIYSEIAAITRSAKVDFEQLADSLVQLEKRCKISWENLKVIAKHENKPNLKRKMTDFLKSCTEKIIILKIIHRRILNRFHSFLLYLGYPSSTVRETKVTSFCKIISEFALEYRTTRERVLQQKQKRAAYRERNKTRGRMIMETENFVSATGSTGNSVTPSFAAELEEETGKGHEDMKNILILSAEPQIRRSRGVRSIGICSPPDFTEAKDDVTSPPTDASDEIMDRLVKSVTQNPHPRLSTTKERKRSRANRKSLRRTLKHGVSDDLAQALGLAKSTEVQV